MSELLNNVEKGDGGFIILRKQKTEFLNSLEKCTLLAHENRSGSPYWKNGQIWRFQIFTPGQRDRTSEYLRSVFHVWNRSYFPILRMIAKVSIGSVITFNRNIYSQHFWIIIESTTFSRFLCCSPSARLILSSSMITPCFSRFKLCLSPLRSKRTTLEANYIPIGQKKFNMTNTMNPNPAHATST